MPSGYQFSQEDTPERDTDGRFFRYGADNYNYNQIIFALYDEEGNYVSSEEITPDTESTAAKGIFKLNGDDYAIPAGYTAIIAYWGYYAGSDLGTGQFTNNAVIDFEQPLKSDTLSGQKLTEDKTSISVSSKFSSYGGYSTSSVKQIWDLSANSKDKENTLAPYLTGDYADGGDETGNGYGNGHENGYGDRDDNFVIAETNGDSVGYAIHIQNTSSKSIDRMVIFDKLPYVNDNGTNNQDSLRGSQFQVLLDTDSPFIIEKMSAFNADTAETVNTDDYIILYSSKTGYTVSEWDSADVTDQQFDDIKSGNTTQIGKWHTDYRADSDLTFRIIFRKGFILNPNEYLRIKFQGIIDDMAQPGQIAWNSFGYKYRISGKTVYTLAPEPAKVGVMIAIAETQEEQSQIAIKKTDEKNQAFRGVAFNVYSDVECSKLVTVITTTSTGEGISNPLPLGTYYIRDPLHLVMFLMVLCIKPN